MVFEPAPVFSVELCGGAGLVLAFKAMSFQCCSTLSCIPGQLVGRGGEGWIVLLTFGTGGWHGDGVGVFICLDCCSSDLTVTDFFLRLGSGEGAWGRVGGIKGQAAGRGSSLGGLLSGPCLLAVSFKWKGEGERVSVVLVSLIGRPSVTSHKHGHFLRPY